MFSSAPCPPPRLWRDFVLGIIDEDEADRLERHLTACRDCLAVVDGLRAEDGLLDDLRGGGLTPSPPPVVLEQLKQMLGAPPAAGRKGAGDVSSGPPAENESRGPEGSAGAEGAQAALGLLAPPQGPGELGRAGPYAVLGLLGTGGMGVVYRARQARPHRLVALKMIPHGAGAAPERLARFRAETEVVARLQHPNIVQVYEVGEHQGRPYFTMEHVDGGSLAQRLAAATLPPRPAAALVQALARAVQFAHERGVVHRDLKPSNVLLTADGLPKISDFGLAKRLGGAAEDGAPDYRTETGAILGTPGYMAPEQAGDAGAAVGPLADVYALGAILYECLTGRPPFKGATPLETLAQLRDQDPVPPGRLQPGLPRDLQTVCLKCLEKEPRRRYASAQELADDLGRFLNGEPVRARPAGPLGRLGKWARRKPAAAALVGVCVLSLFGLAAGMLVHNALLERALVRAEEGEGEARRQHELAMGRYRSARTTLNQMLKRLEGKRRADPAAFGKLRQDQLEDALAFYQEALKQVDNPDPAMRLDTAQAYRQAALIQFRLTRPGPAAENFRRAAALVEGLPEEFRDRAEALDCLADCSMRLGGLAGDRWEAAERCYQKALDFRERLARRDPDDPWGQHGLATAEHHLGVVYAYLRRPDRAEAHYARAISLCRKLVDAHPDDAGYRTTLAGSYVNLGLMITGTPRRRAEAAAAYEKAEALLRPVVRAHPDEPDYALTLAGVYVNWGNLLRDDGRAQEALRLLDQAVELADAVYREEPRYGAGRSRVYEAHGARAQTYEHLGRYADAVPDWDRVLEFGSEAVRPLHRLARALAQARAGEHSRPAAEAGALLAQARPPDDFVYNTACLYALCVAAARADARLGPAEKEPLTERYAGEALAVLRRLQAAGYFAPPNRAAMLRTDTDFDPLRERPDFQNLLAGTAGGKEGT